MTNREQTLRGIGRAAYRAGLFAHHAISDARRVYTHLSEADCAAIYAGYRAERDDLTKGNES